MTKGTKAFFVITVLSIVAILLFGILSAQTIRGTKNPDELLRKTDEITLGYSEQNNHYFADEIQNLKELEEASSVILKAQINDERVMSLRSTETSIKIEKIFKDETNSLQEGEMIYLIEPFSIIRDERYETNGYQMVSTGDEYILFLNLLHTVDGYEFSKKESISFIPSTTKYSRYCLSFDETVSTIIKGAEKLYYKDYVNYSFFSEDESVVSIYRKIQEEIEQEN